MDDAHRPTAQQPPPPHESASSCVDDHPKDPSIPELTSFSLSPSSASSCCTSTGGQCTRDAGSPVTLLVSPDTPKACLDETLSCSKCEASHRFYLMHHKSKSPQASPPADAKQRSARLFQESTTMPTLEFLCSTCWEQQEQSVAATARSAVVNDCNGDDVASCPESSLGASPPQTTTLFWRLDSVENGLELCSHLHRPCLFLESLFVS